MKILPFTPNIPKTTAVKRVEAKGQAAGNDFASELKSAEAKSSPTSVSQGNQMALRVPSSQDIGAAANLLSSLQNDIYNSGADTLHQVHRLEGLLYIYTPANKV